MMENRGIWTVSCREHFTYVQTAIMLTAIIIFAVNHWFYISVQSIQNLISFLDILNPFLFRFQKAVELKIMLFMLSKSI